MIKLETFMSHIDGWGRNLPLPLVTPIPPFESFFMRLTSSSSLLLASLVVSLSLSSLSALAAPVGDGPEDSLSYAPAAVLLAVLLAQQHAPIPPSSDDTVTQPNSEPPSYTTNTFLSNTPTDHLQTRNLVDKVTAPLAVSPELGKAIPDILDAILDALIGEDTPKARRETLDLVKNVVPTVKTTWAEEVDEGGDDAASEDSSTMKASPAAGHQGAPVAGPNPPAGFLRQPSLPRGHAGRQATGASSSNGESEGSGGKAPSHCQCPP